MCDYSLANVASRPAKVGDKLIVSVFDYSITRGFADENHEQVAVCLLPGSQIGFDEKIVEDRSWMLDFLTTHDFSVGKFVQLNMDNRNTHHDAIELPNGKTVLLHNLKPGQRATVLQMPAKLKTAEKAAHEPVEQAAI